MTSWDETPPRPTGAAGDASPHVPVMLGEVLRHLAPRPGEIVVDATFGAGGYSRALLKTGARVVAIDRDPAAIARGAAFSEVADGRLTLVEGLFGELDTLANEAGAPGADGVVLDLGVSSPQLDEAERGFSFRFDGPLDMRMGRAGPTAADIVNGADERDLAAIIRNLGEERRARAVAGAIVAARASAPIITTGRLVEVIEGVVRKAADGIHPATRTFQALRLMVNRELDQLAAALGAAERLLVEGGRLVVVAFHSLEDRIVKRFLADRSRARGGGSRHLPDLAVPEATFRLASRGAETPGQAEVRANPRARSAKLRAAVRTAAPARPIDLAALGLPRLPQIKEA